MSRSLILKLIVLVAMLVTIATEIPDLFEKIKGAASHPLPTYVKTQEGQGVLSVSMFTMPEEFTERMTNGCHRYRLLFFCDTNAPPPPPGVFSRMPALPTMIAVPLQGLLMLPRLPDAAVHMLKERWGRGAIAFTLGVVYLLVYVALLVWALRQESPQNIWIFLIVVVMGPWVTYALFWVIQHLVANLGDVAQYIIAVLIGIVGVPACLAVCIGNDLHDLPHLFRVVARAARALRKP